MLMGAVELDTRFFEHDTRLGRVWVRHETQIPTPERCREVSSHWEYRERLSDKPWECDVVCSGRCCEPLSNFTAVILMLIEVDLNDSMSRDAFASLDYPEEEDDGC